MKLKSFFAFFVSVLVAISLIACTDPTETPTPTISVADITLQEDEVKDIVVVFDPEDATEDYEYEITEGEEFISIRNDKVTGILAGVATVKVTTAPSQLTTTFKVTVTPDPTDPIEKFNAMGGFEGASIKDLGWIESTAGQMAPDGEYKRTGDLSLKIYGGWDEGTETNLTFDYTISAYLRRVPAGEYTLSYYRQGGVQTEIKINDTVYEMNWTHKEEAGWNHYVCYFDLEEQSNISISFHFVADEESDNATERWAVIDDISIIPYKYVKMTLPSIIELDLNPDAERTFAVIDESVYTILPELPEGEEIEDFALTIDPTITAVTIEDAKIIAAEKGETEVTVSFKAYGKEFSETITVRVVNSAEDPILVGIYKQTVEKINEVGGFETDDWAIATLGFANYVDADSITEAYTVGDWKRSGEMAYKLGKDGLSAGKKISVYLDGLNFKEGFLYKINYYTELNEGLEGAVKIFQSLDDVNPYTDEGLYSAQAEAGSGFVKQTLEFVPDSDLNDVVLIFVFENTTESTLWGCLDEISISYMLYEEDIYTQTFNMINQIGGFETDDWEIATLGFANYVDADSITEAYTAGDWKRSGEMSYKLGQDGLPAGKKISIYLDGLYFLDRIAYSFKFYTALNGIQGSVKIFQSLDGVNPYTDEGLYSADIADSSEFMEQTFEFTLSSPLDDVVLIFVFENTTDEKLYGCLDDISITAEIAD